MRAALLLGAVGAVTWGVWGLVRMSWGGAGGAIVTADPAAESLLAAGSGLLSPPSLLSGPLPTGVLGSGAAAPTGRVGLDPTPPNTPPVVIGSSEPKSTSSEPARPAPAQEPGPAAAEPSRASPSPETRSETAAAGAGPITSPDSAAPAAPAASSAAASIIAAGERAIRENKLVEARTLLNRALGDARATERERASIRKMMAEVNETLIFSPRVIPGDPFTDTYVVRGGDTLSRITSRQGLGVDWRLIQRVNRLSRPERINVDQKLKIVRGPFHAVVSKSAFRMDIYAGDPIAGSAAAAGSGALPTGAERDWVYIRSFSVGLGEHGTTPLGTFIVRPSSKLINPFWRNPRTGEEFKPDDPKNPIGEHWLGLDGLDETTRQFQGYGVHGTIDPQSIGKEASMGCVRLLPDDIALVYELLEEGVSVVRIVP